MASDAEQSADDLAWLESEAEKRESAADWSERRARDSTSEFHRQQYVRDARRFGDEAGRFRRIIGSVREQEPSDYLCELEDIICDTLQTLEAATGGTPPQWLSGTMAALRSIVSTMDARRALSESNSA